MMPQQEKQTPNRISHDGMPIVNVTQKRLSEKRRGADHARQGHGRSQIIHLINLIKI